MATEDDRKSRLNLTTKFGIGPFVRNLPLFWSRYGLNKLMLHVVQSRSLANEID